MTERPIIFSAAQVNALLDGRKTQDRRILKSQPKFQGGVASGVVGSGPVSIAIYPQHLGSCGGHYLKTPYAIGDRLWVREQVSAYYFGEKYVHYLADGAKILASDHEKWDALDRYANMRNPDNQSEWGARVPSIHMPRWASRLTLTVTDVRVQRLQDISEDDAATEGIFHRPSEVEPQGLWTYAGINGGWHEPVSAYRALWSSLHGPESWGANPWIVALTFTVQRGNIDKIGGAS